MALALLDRVHQASRIEQEYVYRIAARLRDKSSAADPDDASAAVHACMSALKIERAPSRAAYRVWRDEQDPAADWPTTGAVEEAFGGRWVSVRASIDHEPVADLRGLALVSTGPRRSNDDLLDGIRRWCRECPDPQFRFSSYRRWARKQLGIGEAPLDLARETRETSADPERLLISSTIFLHRFGSWAVALVEAGVLDGVSFETFLRVARCEHSVSRERALEVLRDAQAWATDRFSRRLTIKLLRRYRRETMRRDWEAGLLKPIPSATTILDLFGGSMTQALLTADLIDGDEFRQRLARRGAVLPLITLATHIRICAAFHGVEITELAKRDYDRWRDALVEKLAEPVPSSTTMRGRLSNGQGWPGCLRAVEDAERDEAIERALTEKYFPVLGRRAAP